MRRLRRFKTLAALFLAAQLVVGYLGWLTPQHEIFPFASWFLFSLVPDRVTDYDLLLHGSGSQPPRAPRAFNRAGNLVKGSHSVASYQLIQQLGAAVESHNWVRVENVRRQLEEQFYTSGVRYDLVQVTFQPVERLKTGRVLSSYKVQTFVSGALLPPTDALPPANPPPTPET